jgi:arabinose-5-phosphate isomerase
MMNAAEESLLNDARSVLRSESTSIAAVADKLDSAIVRAMRLIFDRTDEARGQHGSLVATGVGKAGLVALRISASFASTGTPSHHLSPLDAMHGDLGRLRRHDVALLLSYSGETEELVRLLDFLKRQQVPIVAVTSSCESTLGKFADITIELGRIEEVCPHGMAPTTTVNCLSAVGDALVLGVMSLRKFSREDFTAFHPGGSLGRRLIKVSQVMEFKVGENLETIPETMAVRDVLARDPATGRRAGAVVIVNADDTLAGVFTDGDLRRRIRTDTAFLDKPIGAVMTRNPKRVHVDALASEALALMNQYRIDELPVVDGTGKAIGLIDVQDLVRWRVVE